MKNEQTSNFSNGLIWFGAGVSIAEIITGTYLAPLGFQKGLTAIVIGHIIGCILLFLAGCIGGRRRLSSMESGKLAFGKNGSKFFAILNVLLLIGWTGIMIYDGALAANSIFFCRFLVLDPDYRTAYYPLDSNRYSKSRKIKYLCYDCLIRSDHCALLCDIRLSSYEYCCRGGYEFWCCCRTFRCHAIILAATNQ